MILGIGTDIVDLERFREQLADDASGFVAGTFTDGERRDARERAQRGSADEARHLAARFAAKEALIKAWSTSRWGRTPAMDGVDLREIEVVCDTYDRPSLEVTGALAWAVQQSAGVGGELHFHVSLSHDGGYAAATVILEHRS